MRRWPWMLIACAGCDGPLPDVRVGSACPEVVVREVNDHWIATHDDPGDAAWERATYFIGNMAVASALDEPRYRDYAIDWAERHRWEVNGPTTTRNADNHAAGQVYLEFYERDPDPIQIADIIASLDNIIADGGRKDWSWIDAQFMASPTFAHAGELFDDARYHDTMFELYLDARDRRGLYDTIEGLWYRDENYVFPEHRTATGQRIFWSRGNGWVMASLPRTLEHLAPDSPYRSAYEDMLRAMAAALARVQRADGMWNVSLADSEDYPGPEASGTAFFTYAIAWGIEAGLLDRVEYGRVVERAWRGLAAIAVRADGELGLVQGVGEKPGSSQPVTLHSTHDYGVGAFLLAGSAVLKTHRDLDCP